MKFLAAGPYVPLRHGVAGATDWPVFVALIVVMAIAITVVLVYANRSVKAEPSHVSDSSAADIKAA
jgi:hypothetical protein